MRRIPRVLGQFASSLILLLLSVSLVVAQGTDCPTYVNQALDAVGKSCGELGRNQVCYGNTSIDSQFTDTSVHFSLPGDHASVLNLQKLVTAPLNPDNNTWGIAVLSLQANLPDNLPGQN